MEDELKYTALASLLEFYSTRAVAHASFLVASTFGLFTVLSLLNNKLVKLFPDVWVLIPLAITYWAIWFFGLYSLLNFGYFANLAEVTKDRIFESYSEIEKDIMRKARNKQARGIKWFFDLKAGTENLKKKSILYGARKYKIPLLFGLYFLLGVLPFLAILVNVLA